MTDRQLAVEYRGLDGIVPYARNARTHSDAQVAEIAGSIREFGFVNPVLIAEDGTLIAGHGRVLAARLLGLPTVPAITLTGLSDSQRRALVLADNRIALDAGWRGGSVDLNRFWAFSKWFSASVMPPPLRVSAG